MKEEVSYKSEQLDTIKAETKKLVQEINEIVEELDEAARNCGIGGAPEEQVVATFKNLEEKEIAEIRDLALAYQKGADNKMDEEQARANRIDSMW